MPELPEVEAIRQYLMLYVANEVIARVETFQHTVIRIPDQNDFKILLEEATLKEIKRVGKILLFLLNKSDYQLCLFVDQGLTGRFTWGSQKKNPVKTVFSLNFRNGKRLIYFDRRLHGAVWLFKAENNKCIHPFSENLGPDILEISKKEFEQRFKKYRGEIKRILTNQKVIAGIGNAYSDEILFEARIHPFTKRSELTVEEIENLRLISKDVLNNATNSILEFLKSTHKLENQHIWRKNIFQIHLRGGERCTICGGKISTVKAHRITNFCRRCQSSKNPNFI